MHFQPEGNKYPSYICLRSFVHSKIKRMSVWAGSEEISLLTVQFIRIVSQGKTVDLIIPVRFLSMGQETEEQSAEGGFTSFYSVNDLKLPARNNLTITESLLPSIRSSFLFPCV